MNDIPKVVFSRTLRVASWPEARIARGDTALEIGRLKAEPGGEIIVHGGTQFVRSLVRLGLVDRLRFYVVPFAASAGVPLFTADAHPGRLRLEQSTASPGASSNSSTPRRDPANRAGRRYHAGAAPTE